VLVLLLLASFTLITLDARGGDDSPLDPLRSAVGTVLGPVENGTTAAFVQRFDEYLQSMQDSSDLDAVYLQILESKTDNAAAAQRSGIGLLVLRKDHGIRVGVRFGEDEQGRPTITVRAFQTLEGV